MISQGAEYALRAVLWLAANPGAPETTARIAEVTRVPAGYLSKVLQGLGRAGIVVSNPGRSGGFRLTRPAEEIRLLDVVNAVDPITRITKCPLGIESHDPTLCPLHQRLDRVIASVEAAFAESTIADLVAHPSGIKPFCEFDRTE